MSVAIIRPQLDATGLRHAAAQSCGMDRQTLRDWVHRDNEHGLAGLSDRKAPGPTPRLTPEQDAAVAELVRKGPDLAVHGVVPCAGSICRR